MSPRRGGGCLGDTLSGPPRSPVGGGSSSARPGAPQPPPAAAAWRSRAPAAAPRAAQPPPGAPGEDEGGGGRPLHDQPVSAAGPEPLGPRDGAEEPHGDVVLDLPLGSFLLSVCPWCCRSVDVCDATEAQAGKSDLCHCSQHWISGFCNWSDDYQCSSGGHLQSSREEHGPSGSAGVGCWADGIDINHLLLKDPRYTLRFLQECLVAHKEIVVQIP